jgi:hypothetical protein
VAGATQQLEGWLSLMARQADMTAAKAAAEAVLALEEPSDVVASYLVGRLDQDDIGQATINQCMLMRSPECFQQLCAKLESPDLEERGRAAEVRHQCRAHARTRARTQYAGVHKLRAQTVVTPFAATSASRACCRAQVLARLELHQDFQAQSALIVLAATPAGAFFCRPLVVYFRDCQKRNPRWKLAESLHVTLLRLQEQAKHCVDMPFILKELSLTGALVPPWPGRPSCTPVTFCK